MFYLSLFGKNRSLSFNFVQCAILSSALAIVLTLMIGLARAGTTWDGGGGSDTNWGTVTNWDDDALPQFDSGTILTFSTAGTSATNETSRNVGGIVFNSDADFTINGTGSINLYSGITVGSTQTAGRTYTIQAPISYLGGTWTVNNSSSGFNSLNIQSIINGGSFIIGGQGTVQLSSETTHTGQLTFDSESVGYTGTGTFTQTSGINSIANDLQVGWDYSSATYNLSGTGQLSAGYEYIGDYCSTGIFAQIGGTNSITNDLYLGYETGSSGTYNLSGTGQLSAANEYIGRVGMGTFIQSAGTNTISNALYLGYYEYNENGTYHLIGTGQLNAPTEYVGYSGIGIFTQSAGKNSIAGKLYVGYNSGSNGKYTLSGTGILTVSSGGEIRVGADSGTGRFEWFSDGLTTPTLTLGSNGTLAMGFDFDIGAIKTGALFHGGTLNGLPLATLEITNNATATQSGDTSVSIKNLAIGTNTGSGTYNLSDSGQLYVVNEYIGNSGTGTFQQDGGTNSINYSLYLGYNSSDNGTYNLSDPGYLSAPNEYIGYSGTGVFSQNGGINTITSNVLDLGYYSGSNGTYNLSNTGQLSAPYEIIGYSGTGLIVQTGGTNLISNTLDLGHESGSGGTYNLSGTGQLSANNEYIGYSGTGTFTQSGGTNTGAGSDNLYLYLGYGTSSSGTYDLSGTGQLSANSEYIGHNGMGTFTQTGGTNSVTNYLFLGYNSGCNGTYKLNGGTLTTNNLYVGFSGTGRFEWFYNGLTTQTLTLGATGTLAMGFDFDVTALNNGSLFHGTTLSGLSSATLEITNNATATQSGSTSVSIKYLSIGTSSGKGTYNLSGTGQLSTAYEYVGRYGTGTFTQTGGTNSITNNFYLGYYSGSSGTYSLSGTGQLSAASEYIGRYDTGQFTQAGGTNSISNDLYLGYYSGSSGTYNLNGGTLVLKSISKGSGTVAFNFGSGTMQASGNFTTTLPMTLTGDGGNANIDTAGNAVTMSGALSGVGGLNKLGSGILTLNATETYGGNTTVNGGTLVFSGGIGSGGTSLIDVQAGNASFQTVNVNKTNLNIHTVALATFEIINGSHAVGIISGYGTTQVDSGASLTAASIIQNTLTIGPGATVTIRALPGGPQGGAITPVPEPSTLVLLGGVFILFTLARAKKFRRQSIP